MKLEKLILDTIKSQKYKGYTISEFSRALNMEDSDSYKELAKTLNAMEGERVLARDKRERYFTSESLGYMTGILHMNPKGFGFVENDEESFYVSRDNMKLAMPDDKVYVKTFTAFDGRGECEVVEILEHAMKKIVGTIKIKGGERYFLADSFMNGRRVRITNYEEFRVVNGTKVLLEIDSYGQVLKCRIAKVLGHKNDPGVDILSILLENDIEPQFPESVMEAVKKIPETVREEDKENRRDLTNKTIITIDGEDAKDLDDAISVEKIENGYRLGVHIADVSHYVTERSAFDLEAYHRGTSVYVVDRVVPMLPHALSNGICSLNPKVERLTLTCEMDIDKKGEIMQYQIYPSFIKTTERMTYTKVNEILDGDETAIKEYQHIYELCQNMYALSKIIRKRRHTLGAIDFDAKEAKVIVNEKGKPVDIVLRERGEAERIIEDFMIAANECVATHMKWLEIPSIYRIHETPEPKKMREFARIAKTLKYQLKGNIQSIYPKQLQELLEEAKGHENYSVLSTYMLRSMQKARYDNKCLGHFGLALQEYLHFTSPIRRYPDLIVHRMLRKYAFEHNSDPKEMMSDEKRVEDCAIQASVRERKAVDAERAVDDMKKAEYMERYVGDVFVGYISGITKFGFFVELENTVEGLVHVSTLTDDHYVYDDFTKTLVGSRTANVYKMGQKVKVKCTNANRYKREIDFEILLPKQNRKRKGKRR